MAGMERDVIDQGILKGGQKCREEMVQVLLDRALSAKAEPEWAEATEAGWAAAWLPDRAGIVYALPAVKECRISRGRPAAG